MDEAKDREKTDIDTLAAHVRDKKPRVDGHDSDPFALEAYHEQGKGKGSGSTHGAGSSRDLPPTTATQFMSKFYEMMDILTEKLTTTAPPSPSRNGSSSMSVDEETTLPLHPEIKTSIKALGSKLQKDIMKLHRAHARLSKANAEKALLLKGEYPVGIKEFNPPIDDEWDEVHPPCNNEELIIQITVPMRKTRREAAKIIHAKCYEHIKQIDIDAITSARTQLEASTKLEFFTTACKTYTLKSKELDAFFLSTSDEESHAQELPEKMECNNAEFKRRSTIL